MALRMAAGQGRLVVFGYNAVTSHIEWIRGPEASHYAGEAFSLKGSQVMAYYKDGTVSDITRSCSYDPADGARLDYSGELNITATYSDHAGNQFTADHTITVEDVEELIFVGIDNTVQKEGTSLDLSGAQFRAKYTDGSTRIVPAGSVTLDPNGGAIGHMDTLPIQASWKNPATGSEYHAEYDLAVDPIDKLFSLHGPDKLSYTEGEALDLTGAVVAIRYKQSGDTQIVTGECSFEPAEGTALPAYGTSISATYTTPAGDQYTCEYLLNVEASTMPIDEIGMLVGEDLGLEFTDDLPADFWDVFEPQDVPYLDCDGDLYVSVDDFDSIVDYLNKKNAFAEYNQSGNIPYMVLPAGEYFSANGEHSIKANADIYIIATIQKKNGKPEQLPAPSIVDYPYTDDYDFNQIHVLSFTLKKNDYVVCKTGLRGSYNSAEKGICRKPAGLGLPNISDETMYTDYVTSPVDDIVNIPGILNLPWCWYDDVPHNLTTLKRMVQNGTEQKGCTGVTPNGEVPYFTYSGDSLYSEVREQFPEKYPSTINYGDQEYVSIKA